MRGITQSQAFFLGKRRWRAFCSRPDAVVPQTVVKCFSLFRYAFGILMSSASTPSTTEPQPMTLYPNIPNVYAIFCACNKGNHRFPATAKM
jgi:hypothetical protein